MKRAVFIDRDGTVVRTRSYGNEENVAPRSPDDLELIPETSGTLNELRKAGYLIIVTSNQPDVALGKIDEPTREAMEKKFRKLLQQNNIPIDGIYYCYHHPESINPRYPKVCNCRKPKPGMIFEAAQKWNTDPKNSWVVGDTYKDIGAGHTAGCRTILIKKPYSGECRPNFTVNSLSAIVDIFKKKS